MIHLCVRKLALWYSKTFQPLMTHNDLEPILAGLGFVGQPPSGVAGSNSSVVWKEYRYPGRDARARRFFKVAGPKIPPEPPALLLPYPRIDGLHIDTFLAFLDALSFYLNMNDVSDLFHLRGIPLDPKVDGNKLDYGGDGNNKAALPLKWRSMEDDDHIFVYRDGTKDDLYCFKNPNDLEFMIRSRGMDDYEMVMVPFKDICNYQVKHDYS